MTAGFCVTDLCLILAIVLMTAGFVGAILYFRRKKARLGDQLVQGSVEEIFREEEQP